MNRTFLRQILWILILLCSSGVRILAETDTSPIKRNRDGSAVKLLVKKCKLKGPCFSVSVRRGKSLIRKSVINIARTETDSANLSDIDKDGYFDLEIRGECGNGPNCEGNIYRFDPKIQTFYHFFSSSYAGAEVIDGYLVETGRASCCSWESNAYKIPRNHQLIAEIDFSISIRADIDGNTIEIAEKKPSICTFSRFQGDGDVVIKPPSRRWLRFCEVNGEFVIEKPSRALLKKATKRSR